MKTATYLTLLFLVSIHLYSQEIPEVKVNHFNFVLEFDDLKALRESSFIRDTFAACETRIAKINDQDTAYTAYLFGQSNYFELFDASVDDPNLGFCAIGFSVDKIGEIDTLSNILSKSFFPGKNSMTRTIDSITIPWFDVLVVNDFSLMDSSFMAQMHFWFWIMEYRKEYFEYNHYTIIDDELTRENYLGKYAVERKNKIVKNFSGLVLKLNPGEKEYLTKFFNSIGYEKLNENEYRSHDNFRFLIKNRNRGDHNSIESIQFETTENFLNKRIIKVSDHVIITLEGSEGQISFQ